MAKEVCSRCHQKISDSRKHQTPPVCDHCGHVLSEAQLKLEDNLKKATLASFFAVALILLTLFFQLREWGGYFVEIRFLQMKEISGGSNEVYERIAVICLELQKYDCVEGAYAELAHRDSKDWSRLGTFQMSRAEYSRAIDAFAAYFRAGHEDIDSKFRYAKALAETGDLEKATDEFEKIIRSKPKVLQVTVVQSYVKYLIKGGRLEQAVKVIDRMRRLDESKSSFMESDYRLIAEKKASKT